jgi:DNA adenine methylase
MTYNLLFLPEVEEDVIAGYMTNTHHATMEELVIGKNLSWMDSFPAVHEPEVEYIVQKNKKRYTSRRAERKR